MKNRVSKTIINLRYDILAIFCFITRKPFIDSCDFIYIMQDHFTKRAKAQGYRARSVFKLKDIVKKYQFVKPTDSVLDLGASPGSWMQYLSRFCRYVLGVDISDVEDVKGAYFLKKNVMDEDIVKEIQKYKSKFDVIISDMAPKTTGQTFVDQESSLVLCERAWFIATHVLRGNGNFLCKIFQSKEGDDFLRELRKEFKLVKTSKPEGSKKKSKEVFYVSIGYKVIRV